MSSIDLLYMVCCVLRDLYRIRHRHRQRQEQALLRVSPAAPTSGQSPSRGQQTELLLRYSARGQKHGCRTQYNEVDNDDKCCPRNARSCRDSCDVDVTCDMDVCWSRDTCPSARVKQSTMETRSTVTRLKTLNLDKSHVSDTCHLSTPPAHFRIRSPSPLESPAHLHLAMEAGMPPAPPHLTMNNNTEKDPNHRQVPPIPSMCSSQLAKVLEKQIESNGVGAKCRSPGSSSRPIYPNLPYSPYSSPNSSPRVRRRPLKMTKQASTEHMGNYMQLNQYKLMGMVGQGSYSIVKMAYNVAEDTHYAMKILSKKKLQKKAGIFGRIAPTRKGSGGRLIKKAENPLDKVYREIAILKKVDHPNVVKLVEVVDDPEEDNLYMVFELLEKGEILEIPTEKPLTEDEAWRSFRDVISGLEYLHYQKIIHRDIKPSNLLRADNGEVKIADLGVSNEFDGTDAFLTNTAGTPAFTAPECLSVNQGDSPYSGKAADIWSLGVTLYCLVFGNVPFHDDNILVIYNKIRTQQLQFPIRTDLSPELIDLIQKMLVKDPRDRIKLQDIKIHSWVTGYGIYPMMKQESNCCLIEVTEDDVENSVKSIPKLDTLILVKAMIKKHSFANPFPSIRQKFGKNGRSNSAPGAFDIINDSGVATLDVSRLPSLSEDSTEEDVKKEDDDAAEDNS